MNKKGLSDVVTTVLIILLVMIAIAILWAFVKPMFDKAGTNIESSSECLAIQLKVTKCAISGNISTITVERGTDNSQALNGVKLIVKKADGTQSTLDQPTYPAQLETKLYNLSVVGSQVSAAAIVKTKNGQDAVCQSTSDPVSCS